MKTFVKIFLSLLLFELIFGFFVLYASIYISNEFLNGTLSFLISILAYPIQFLDRTYPFYAVGSFGFQLFLVIINVFFQSFFIFLIFKKLKK